MNAPVSLSHRPHRPVARLVLDLLAFAAGGQHGQAGVPAWSQDPSPWLEPAALEHVAAAGLAPLLHEAAASELERLEGPERELLHTAKLSALLRHDERAGVAAEVIEVANGLRIPVTLLKGISISEQHYPAPWLRPMGDIDLLVPTDGRQRLQAALQQRGYMPHPGHWDDHPHAAPLCHPEAAVWVEVHDALFPQDSAFATGTLFGRESLSARSKPHSLRGMPVHRLSDELQLVYIASAWIRDLSQNALHPSFLVPLFDAVLLLRASATRIDWQRTPEWLDNEAAAAALYLMLSYLDRHGLAGAASTAVPQLARQQGLLGPLETRLLHTMLDRWLLDAKTPAIGRRTCMICDRLVSKRSVPAKLGGLPWLLMFPPDVPDRFSLAHLRRMASRLASLCRANCAIIP